MFTVSFTDGCSAASLTPASNLNLVSGGPQVSLYEDLVIQFTPASSSLPGCGNISYEVIDLATGSLLVIEVLEFDTISSPATLTLLSINKDDAVDPLQILIRANQVNVATADSDVLDLDFVDPCLTTEITQV